MAKKDLIGGSLWSQYSKKVSDRMNNPKYRGEITEKEAKKIGGKLIVADWGAESCGDAIRLFWVVDPTTDKILKASFKSFGCGTAIAASDMMVDLCTGKTVDEAKKITNIDVELALRDEKDTPAVPPQKMHCSVMAYDVIKKAISHYKGVDISDLEEKEIVCECAQVSLDTIVDVIKVNNLKTIEEITQFTKAGAFCKSCIRPGGHEKRKYYLVDILTDTIIEMDKNEIQRKSESDDFATMSTVRKLKKVELILNDKIKPMLAADGGNLEVVDLKEEGGDVRVYIEYLGACKTCPSSKIGTFQAIENALQENISKNIKVIVL